MKAHLARFVLQVYALVLLTWYKFWKAVYPWGSTLPDDGVVLHSALAGNRDVTGAALYYLATHAYRDGRGLMREIGEPGGTEVRLTYSRAGTRRKFNLSANHVGPISFP